MSQSTSDTAPDKDGASPARPMCLPAALAGFNRRPNARDLRGAALAQSVLQGPLPEDGMVRKKEHLDVIRKAKKKADELSDRSKAMAKRVERKLDHGTAAAEDTVKHAVEVVKNGTRTLKIGVTP